MKPRVEPIKTEIIKEKEKEKEIVKEIQMIVEDKTEEKPVNELYLYSILNNFQEQINNIMVRLTNLEIKN